MNHFRRTVIVLAVFSLLAFPLGAAAADAGGKKEMEFIGHRKTDSAAMLVDVLATRPLGAASFAVGTVTYIASLPFSLLGGNAGESFNRLVADPFVYTFFRRLGDI